VHHSAIELTPFTVWRVHIVSTIMFINMVAVAFGVVQGFISYFVGDVVSTTAVACTHFSLYAFLGLYGHLQHTRIWIPLRGTAGHIFYSPAHHQIHHSTNPIHYDKNLGLSLAVFDWLFGTLYMPAEKDEKLSFGVQDHRTMQYFVISMLYPFYGSWKQIRKIPARAMRSMRARRVAYANDQPETEAPSTVQGSGL
jgi:sterol desaturase/sphingolipid hydroxylase (fatty acid hydroxylase superfamily)